MNAGYIYTLAGLSAARPDAEKLAEIVRGLSPRDWPPLLNAAGLHALTPLICGTLAKAGLLDSIPPDARHALISARKGTAAMNMLLMRQHDLITSAAAAGGIRLMPLKGAYLLGKYYSIEERPLTDLDYMIEPDAAEAPGRLMAALGFSPVSGRYIGPEFTKDFGGEENYEAVIGGALVSVELHRELLPSAALKAAFSMDESSFWKHSAPGAGGNPELCIEHTLLFEAVHLSVVHCFSRLIWLADIDRILRAENVRWDFLMEEAARMEVDIAVCHTMRAARRLYGAPVPESVLERSAGSRKISDATVDSWIAGAASAPSTSMVPLYLSRRPARFLARHLFPPVSFLRQRYGVPAWQAPAFYVARPFLLAANMFLAGKRQKK